MNLTIPDHVWAEIHEISGSVSMVAGYVCQQCGETAPCFVVMCRPGEERLFIDRVAEVIASPYTGLRYGEAYRIDGRITRSTFCFKPRTKGQ
jgi:hypothetical protein